MPTIRMQVNLNDAGRMSWDLALVYGLVVLFHVGNLQSPVVGVLELHFVALITRVRVHAHCQQVQGISITNTTAIGPILRVVAHPRDLFVGGDDEDVNVHFILGFWILS